MTAGRTVPTGGCTIVLVGDFPSTVDIEDGLHTCPDAGSVISVESVGTALDILERVPVHCLVYGFSRTGPADRPGKEPESEDAFERSIESIERLVDAAGDRPVIAVAEDISEQVLEAGVHDVIRTHTPLEAAVARILDAAARYQLESITVPESILSDPRSQPPLEELVHQTSIAYDDLQTERDRLESLLNCLYTACWRLTRAQSRGQIEKRLCKELSSLEDIDLVWVGRLTPEVLELTPETRVGDRAEYLEEQSYSLEGEDLSPAAKTAISGTRTVIEDTTTQPSESRWVRTALEHGIRSICSAPINCQGITYGCLTVCSADPGAFDRWTVDGVSALAAVSGVLVNRLELRAGIYADRTVELEVLIDGGDDPLIALAETVDQRVDIESVVPRSTFGSVGTLSVPSISKEVETDPIGALAGVRSVRTISADPGSARLQMQFSERTIADVLSERGAVVRSLDPVGNRFRVTIEIPADRSVRRVVRLLENEIPNTELITRRSERSPRDGSESFEARLTEELTERQRQTLESAYYNGYFDWPRERTGEEIADSLDVSQPTFTRHFRTAQRKLFDLLYDK